jgi:hypothetical protein
MLPQVEEGVVEAVSFFVGPNKVPAAQSTDIGLVVRT